MDGYVLAHPELENINTIEILTAVSFMVGFMQLFLGCFRLGIISSVLSDNLLSSFTIGCAILIFNSQVKPFLGLKYDLHNDTLIDNLSIPSDTINVS